MFEKLFLQEIKRCIIQQQILEQKPTFLALKVEKCHVPEKLFLFFVKISPGDFFWHRRIFADFETGF